MLSLFPELEILLGRFTDFVTAQKLFSYVRYLKYFNKYFTISLGYICVPTKNMISFKILTTEYF